MSDEELLASLSQGAREILVMTHVPDNPQEPDAIVIRSRADGGIESRTMWISEVGNDPSFQPDLTELWQHGLIETSARIYGKHMRRATKAAQIRGEGFFELTERGQRLAVIATYDYLKECGAE